MYNTASEKLACRTGVEQHCKKFARIPFSLQASKVWILCIGTAMLSILAGSLDAQQANLRYELGKRVERYERKWQESSEEQRAASTPFMERAVRDFFKLDLTSAAAELDQAWLAMIPPTDKDDLSRLAPLSISIDTTILNAKKSTLQISLRSLYSTKAEEWKPASAKLHVVLVKRTLPRYPMQTDSVSLTEMRWTMDKLSFDVSWNLDFVEPGDYEVLASIVEETVETPIISTHVSFVDNLDERLSVAKTWLDVNKRAEKANSICTARMLGKQLQLTSRGKTFECDLPLSKWIDEFERLTSNASRASEISFNPWRVLTDGNQEQIVRMHLPANAPKENATLIFAFHGAGGSENMFFEAYGAGRLIELANARDWIVVCPRQGFGGLNLSVESMIPLLESDLERKFEKIFLVGHSMGAAQAIEQVSKFPDRIKAVVAVGGGGAPRKTEAIAKIPFYVSAGEKDFGRGAALGLSNKLRSYGCEVKYSEFKDVEHMTIMQASLDEAFEFLRTN